MNKRERKSVLRYDPSLEHNKENTLKNNTIESKLKENNRVEKNLLKQLKDENLRLEAENKVLKDENLRLKDQNKLRRSTQDIKEAVQLWIRDQDAAFKEYGSEEVGHIPTPVPKPYTFEEDQIILQAQMENPKNWTDKAMNRLKESGFYRTILSIQSRFSKRLRDRSDEAVITDENKENNPVAQISSNTSRGISTRKRTSADAHVDTVNASKNLSKRSRILT